MTVKKVDTVSTKKKSIKSLLYAKNYSKYFSIFNLSSQVKWIITFKSEINAIDLLKDKRKNNY